MNEVTRNLLTRTITGIILVAVMLAAMLLGRLTFAALLFCLTAGCMWEMYSLAGKTGARPQKIAGTAIGLLAVGVNLSLVEVVVNNISYLKYMIMAMVLIILLTVAVFVMEIWRRKGNPIQNTGATFMAVAYVALPMSLIALFPLAGNKMLFPWNAMIVPAYFIIVWANDVFAYLFGITLGKHRLCERLSPKKSWEGFFGGLIGAVAIGFAVGKFLVHGNAWLWMGLGLLIGLTSVLGDLLESHFKRSVNVKDSGNTLPGHGGLLDRFDAIFVSAPFVFIFFIIVLLMNGSALMANFAGFF